MTEVLKFNKIGQFKGVAGDIATMALQGRSPYEMPKSRHAKV